MTEGAAPTDLRTSRHRLQAGFDAGDIDAVEELITDDVVWRVSGSTAWVGRAEVQDRLGAFFERFEYRFRLEDTHLDVDRERAVERSNFVSVVTEVGHTSAPHRGSVVILWVRDGVWKVAAYVDVGAVLFT